MRKDPVDTTRFAGNPANNGKLNVIRIENDQLQLSVLPDFGGKIYELINKLTGTQFLAEPGGDPASFSLPRYGDTFEPPYSFGFDECFPNITMESSRVNGHVAELPDHGEIWSRGCEVRVSDDELILISAGKALNYNFEKRITLIKNRVVITYTLVNNESYPFHYIWSAHPLLAVDEGDRILLSGSSSELLLNWSSDQHLGEEGSTLQWPKAEVNGGYDFSVVKSRRNKTAAKLFTAAGNGRAGVYRKKSDETLMFHTDPAKVPYLGIWLCYGGWPVDSEKGEYTVAIEPTLAEFDSLNRARNKDQSLQIAAGGTHTWKLEISIDSGLKKP